MSVSCRYAFNLTTTETLESGVAGVSSPSLSHNAYDESGTLNASSTPPATKIATFLMTLSAGAATINLAALTGVNGASIDLTGLRVQMLRIKNLSASNALTFSEGASNGIALVGLPEVVPAGGIFQKFYNDASPDIAAADRTIDVSGTGTDTAEITIIAG